MKEPILQADIVLATFNTTYQHASMGLRYLYANLGSLKTKATIVEMTGQLQARDAVEKILKFRPRIVGLGVYIWNATLVHEVILILKQVSPEVLIIVGGPEVSHECDSQAICLVADVVVRGEGDLVFAKICQEFLETGETPTPKLIEPTLPPLDQLELPYPYFFEEDIQHRILYVEASRGCPFRCEYCLSSLDTQVRNFPLEKFLGQIEELIGRGARHIKFVDRTFNLSPTISNRILEFFLERIDKGLFLHFEMVPDRLPQELRDLIKKFPPGTLQFEVGVQTWNPAVATLVSRKQDYSKIEENLRFLHSETKVHVHADLIAGLPGESIESFSQGFDHLASLGPHEIQMGLLKKLKGTPIKRHDSPYEMVYQATPPFQILKNRDLDFMTVQKLTRFSKYWESFANSGNFPRTMMTLRDLAQKRKQPSLFWMFWEFSEFLSTRHPHSFGIALANLVESAWIFLIERQGMDPEIVRAALHYDYCVHVKRDVPSFLRLDHEERKTNRPNRLSSPEAKTNSGRLADKESRGTPYRQKKHIGQNPKK